MRTTFNPFTGKLDYLGLASLGASYPALILTDSTSVRWAITVDTTGHLVTTARTSGPQGAFSPNSFGLEDSAGVLWKVTVNPGGDLVTTNTGTFASSLDKIVLNDANNISWIVSVNTSGDLVTS
jgi:hypothetical protein